jgi:NodT family efflux transporter outer membrane factor (OMF) lipoprotein
MQASHPRIGGPIAAGFAAAALALTLAGCAVGPDFKEPAPPATEAYLPGPPPAPTSSAAGQLGAAQHFMPGGDIPGEWWTLFHSKPLNDLVERALKNNPTLEAAQASLKQAWENVYAQQGVYYPQVTGAFAETRNKTATGSVSPASASGNPYYSLATAQLNVSFTPDVFGLNQRTVESLVAQAENQKFQLEATYLTLTSNVVAAAVNEASLRGQIEATEQTVKIDTDLTALLRKQFELGQVAMGDVVAQEALLAQAEETLPPLRKQLAQQRDALAALLGASPADDIAEQFNLAGFELPIDLPVTLPSTMVEQRPDVRAASATLHAASASVGVAIANRLPQFTLTAFGGSQANKLYQLFTPGNGFWTLSAGLTQPIFEGATLLHRERAADAALVQAAAQYKSTVLSALQNVADALRAVQFDADTLKAAVVAEHAASQSLEITQTQLRLGAVAYLSLLNAEQTFQTARLATVQAQAGRLADTAALFQALGGGWWHRQDPDPSTQTGGLLHLD